MNHIYQYIFCIHLFYFAIILLPEVPKVCLGVIYRNAASDSFFYLYCYVIDTGSEASVVASCDIEAHTLHTQEAFSIHCCFHSRITATFSTFWSNPIDWHQKPPALVQILSSYLSSVKTQNKTCRQSDFYFL